MLHPPDARGGARGYYHRGAIALACLIDHLAGAGHRASAPRGTVRDLAPILAGWRREAGLGRSAGAGEDAFYARVVDALESVREGGLASELSPGHRDVLPAGQGRVAPGEREQALGAAARVAQAIADGWVAEHEAEPAPERLVVWFRMERAGGEGWRIAGAGARRTSHDARRLRVADGAPGAARGAQAGAA